MIKIKNVSKSFDDKLVLNNINLEIKDGAVLGLIGINGAGKSTLLRLISGVFEVDSGEILIDSVSIKDNPRVKNKLFFLPDEPFYSIYDTPLTLSKLYKEFYGLDETVFIQSLKDFEIDPNAVMNNFSKGMKRRVFISLALSIGPKYLLLDEAFDGLDPVARLKFKKTIVDLIDKYNTTIIIASHSLRELEDICDSYAMIDNHEITYSGDLLEHLSMYHKYNIAFKEEVLKENFDFEIIQYHQDKRFVTIVVKLDLEEFESKIEHLNPLLIDEVRIDFEELFILEVGNRGYL